MSSVDTFQVIKIEKQFSNYIRLDNKKDFLFNVLNEKNDILFSSLEPESISDYNEKAKQLLSNAKELDQYEVIEESPDVFVIYLARWLRNQNGSH